jgi:peptide/nickel transport system substrate-binding protein
MKIANVIKGLFGILILMWAGMHYWSSLLQEHDLKELLQEMKELREETISLQIKLSRDLQVMHARAQPASSIETSLVDPLYPSLLTIDTYHQITLPTLLTQDFRPQGLLKRAIIGKPENLHPFNNFKDVQEMYRMCIPPVAELKTGCYETLSPCLGVKIEARPCLDHPELQEYWVFLRDDVYWSPLQQAHFPDSIELASHFLQKHRVTAHDFKFCYDAIMNPYIHEAKAASLRTYYDDIESLTVVNATTFVVRWKAQPVMDDEGITVQKAKYTSLGLTGSLQPLPCFVYQYFADGGKIIDETEDPDIYRKNSVWAQNFEHHWAKNVIVSCGPYLFSGMSDESIAFKRNPYYFDPFGVLIEGVKFTFKESADAVWQDFKGGKIDICTLSPTQLKELDSFLASEEYRAQQSQGQEIQILDYIDLSYFYIGWNLAKPFFADEKVRKALTLAIDRERIIEQNLNLMAMQITGPFFLSSAAYDTSISPYPYQPEEARRLLEEAGWIDLDGDGIRDKIVNGQKTALRFKLYYFVKSLSTKVIAEYITTTLRNIGVHCELCGLDIADLSRQFDDKDFDAIFMGWKLGTPPEDPRQLWHSAGAYEKGSSNAIGFANSLIDSIIEKLNYEYDKPKRIALYHQFHQIIHAEVPYTFLYTPKVRLLYRSYIHNLFIPKESQETIPEADSSEPYLQSIWLSK